MNARLILISVGLIAQNACVSTEAAYTLGGATLGGMSGALASAENRKILPLASAGGVLAGGLLGGMFARSVKAGRRSAFTEGYQRGASDTVKRQYWILQNLQKENARRSEGKWTSYQVPVELSGVNHHQISNEITIPILK